MEMTPRTSGRRSGSGDKLRATSDGFGRLRTHPGAYGLLFGPSKTSARSQLPYQFTTAATLGSSEPGHASSHPGGRTPSPAATANHPPDEDPETTSFVVSKPYSLARLTIHRSAHKQFWRAAGANVTPASR